MTEVAIRTRWLRALSAVLLVVLTVGLLATDVSASRTVRRGDGTTGTSTDRTGDRTIRDGGSTGGSAPAATVAQPPVTPSNPAPVPTGACRDGEEWAMLSLINGYRAANSLGPVQITQTLSNAAEFHSADMASKNYFSHTLANGTSWSQNMTNFGYGYQTYRAENIAAGNATAAATFEQWRTSPGHNANMLSPTVTAIGIGRAYGAASSYGTYWTTTFGGVVDGAAC
ncbi:MAG: CAP domain-containing protein [Chloroflexota bacterium]|nr:CAP domain-containing protein [Chloroflexota bacterium]